MCVLHQRCLVSVLEGYVMQCIRVMMRRLHAPLAVISVDVQMAACRAWKHMRACAGVMQQCVRGATLHLHVWACSARCSPHAAELW